MLEVSRNHYQLFLIVRIQAALFLIFLLCVNITPLLKKGDKLKATNHRPVSLTSIFCTVMESVIRDTLINHLTRNNLIYHSQHGFMPNKSCCTNLLEALDIVTQALEEDLSIDIAFLDFAKAFDSVAHERLLLKYKAYRIREDLLRWFKGYLSDRIQRVVLGENTSEWKKVTSGVPQGSVTLFSSGPLFFVIYINDLMQDLKNSCKLYADDTKVISVINKIEDNRVMQQDLNKLVELSENWLIDFNKDKCKIMHIG